MVNRPEVNGKDRNEKLQEALLLIMEQIEPGFTAKFQVELYPRILPPQGQPKPLQVHQLVIHRPLGEYTPLVARGHVDAPGYERREKEE
ncbi:MAG: hypothetical protein DWQ01_08495 [Planctomycetota bacterium]|nr:MAG: hypothetical protein DWQ01_08495 [Planctomycetota bacterium]